MIGKFYIIGMGMGASYMIERASRAIEISSTLVFTSKRLLESFEERYSKKEDVEYFVTYKKSEIDGILKERENGKNVSILVSGDVGFYSIASQYRYSDAIFIPGISSYQALSAHFHLSYANFAFASIHGRDERRAISTIRRNEFTFLLLSNEIESFADLLSLYGMSDLNCYVGCDIGGKNESFSKCTAYQLSTLKNTYLKSIVIENPSYDSRVRAAIEDSFFLRERGIPMSKRAIRAMVLSELDLKPTDVVWDIGCGSGSVTVEAGLSAYDGWIYAIDVKREASELTQNNLIKAQVANASIAVGCAPDKLDDFEAPDAVFIGGSNSNMDSIIKKALEKNENVRIVLTAISLDTLSSALSLPYEWNIMNIQSSVSRKIGSHHMMSAENPIYILSFGGNNE